MRVYRDRVVIHLADGREIVYEQGPMSPAAQSRYKRIKKALDERWLDNAAGEAMSPAMTTKLSADWVRVFEAMSEAITPESGRAMVAITLIQLAVKAIEPGQSIRLTKGRTGKGGGGFSWVEGLSMRNLSSDYFVDFFERYELVFGNEYGPFMTRGFAENYPYSPFYKADLRGPRKEWDKIVEGLEDGSLDAREGFLLLCSLLANRSTEFKKAAKETIRAVRSYLATDPGFDEVRDLISHHVRSAPNSARPLEVAMHSLLQAMYPPKIGPTFELRPLSQMRSANLKARNVGDVELLQPHTKKVVQAWDAKSGPITIGSEIDGLRRKLLANRGVLTAGFVMDQPPHMDPNAINLIAQIRKTTGTNVETLVFEDWVAMEAKLSGDAPKVLGAAWLTAYAESLCQMRREIAPIDEPSKPWVDSLRHEVEMRLP